MAIGTLSDTAKHNLEGMKYFDVIFCHDHLLTKPNICAEFEQNRWFELYHLLPGFLMDTLFIQMFVCSFKSDLLLLIVPLFFDTQQK